MINTNIEPLSSSRSTSDPKSDHRRELHHEIFSLWRIQFSAWTPVTYCAVRKWASTKNTANQSRSSSVTFSGIDAPPSSPSDQFQTPLRPVREIDTGVPAMTAPSYTVEILVLDLSLLIQWLVQLRRERKQLPRPIVHLTMRTSQFAFFWLQAHYSLYEKKLFPSPLDSNVVFRNLCAKGRNFIK